MQNSKYSISANCVTLEIITTKGKQWPAWRTSCNSVVIRESIEQKTKTQIVNFDIDLDQTNLDLQLCIHPDADYEQTFRVKNIWVNHIKLDYFAIYKHITFVPNYTLKDLILAKQKNKILPSILQEFIHELNYNGNWNLSFQQPFFVWYKNLSTIHAQSLSVDKQSDLFGQISPEQIDRVKCLLQQFSK